MKIYKVGGCVRDELLGLDPKDYDYVVVGSSPTQMIEKGFKQVGKDFPVFIHPDTGDEYALARKERKVGMGYNGFECEWEGVSLEDDLLRRDLTINAMAVDLSTGNLIDPYCGKKDLQRGLLRPTSESFQEDPIRVLRAGRFLARYPNFKPTLELISLSKEVADEVHHCSPDRVWRELEKSLTEVQPSRFFEFCSYFGIFEEWAELEATPQKVEHHPEIWCDTHTGLVMDIASFNSCPPEVVFACLCHDFGKPICYEEYGNAYGHEDRGIPVIEEFCTKWKVPNKYKDLAILVCKYHTKIHGCMGRNTNDWMRPKSIMKLFEETRAIQQPKRFANILLACKADAQGRGMTQEERYYFSKKEYPQMDYLSACLSEVVKLDTRPISEKLLANGKDGVTIGKEIRAARVNRIREVQRQWKIK